MTPGANGTAPFAGTIPLQEISLPLVGGALGIPEIVLAAYRNAELAMESSTPGCGLSWSLLAGIGRIESGHAGGGRTDAAGTTVTPIYGPALDGTLPGNEIIKSASGGYVRAVGPMQFLPGTWAQYAADGNGDGVSDPNNVFDAALGAAKYLCSGGLDLRDPAQELRSVLRYNNSTAYAANVLSWAAAYRTGGSPTQVTIAPDIIPPGSAPIQVADMQAVDTTKVTYTSPPATPETGTTTQAAPAPTEVMITIPGLPPIPCGIFCPPPKPLNPCEQVTVPAPMPRPGDPAPTVAVPGAAEQSFGVGVAAPKDPAHPDQAVDPAHPDQAVAPVCTTPQAGPEVQAQAPQQQAQAPEQAQQPGPDSAPTVAAESAPTVTGEPPVAPAAAPPPPPAITLPFGVVIPLPAPQG